MCGKEALSPPRQACLCTPMITDSTATVVTEDYAVYRSRWLVLLAFSSLGCLQWCACAAPPSHAQTPSSLGERHAGTRSLPAHTTTFCAAALCGSRTARYRSVSTCCSAGTRASSRFLPSTAPQFSYLSLSWSAGWRARAVCVPQCCLGVR